MTSVPIGELDAPSADAARQPALQQRRIERWGARRGPVDGRTELDRSKAEHPHANADPAEFEPIRAGLANVKLPVIMAACGVSKATASGWRSGRYVPPLRHWDALTEVAACGLLVDRSNAV